MKRYHLSVSGRDNWNREVTDLPKELPNLATHTRREIESLPVGGHIRLEGGPVHIENTAMIVRLIDAPDEPQGSSEDYVEELKKHYPREDTLYEVGLEVARARIKHPHNRQMLAAIMEELGELAQALLEKEDTERVRAEAKQVAATAIRLMEEGDASFESEDWSFKRLVPIP